MCIEAKGPFGAHDRETGYDSTILSYLNPLFGAPIGYDKSNLLFILSYTLFVILILSLGWVGNLITKKHARLIFLKRPSFDYIDMQTGIALLSSMIWNDTIDSSHPLSYFSATLIDDFCQFQFFP